MWTPAFVVITLAGLAYFTALGALLPVLPHFVEDELGGSGFAIGLAVGAFSVSAALLRPAVGRLGDLRGRRLLVVGGGLVVAASIAGYALASNLVVLVVLRLLTGAGEAAFFVGAATAVQDLAPPERRGEAASFFSVSLYGGLAIGPPFGEYVSHHLGWHQTWFIIAACAAVAPLVGKWVPSSVEGDVPTRRGFLHTAAIGPGVVLVLAMMGFAAFGTFVPTWTDHLDLHGSGGVFGLYAVIILLVRLVGAKVPDRFGPLATSVASLFALVAGLTVMTSWPAPAGLYAGTAVFSVGMSLLFPALFLQVMRDAPDEERSHAVGTFSLFFDLSQGLGAPLLGVLVSVADERAAFGAAAVLCTVGLVVLASRRAQFREPVALVHDTDAALLAEPH
ncbi:MAG TPA: MFS transporter [Acidimicrobiales bacterium]|nr:MFS transporter [Acidimicrobiales bacterium]